MKLNHVHSQLGGLVSAQDIAGACDLISRAVGHKRDEYVRGGVHLNGIEGLWSFAKNWLYHYLGVPRDYFPFYLKEIEFRFNNRQQDLFSYFGSTGEKSVPVL